MLWLIRKDSLSGLLPPLYLSLYLLLNFVSIFIYQNPSESFFSF